MASSKSATKPRRKRTAPLPEPAPAMPEPRSRVTLRPWVFSLGVHALALLVIVLLAGLPRPVEATSQPIELVDVTTDGPVGDQKEPGHDRPTAKAVVQRVLPKDPTEHHAERAEHVEAPRAREAAAPRHHSLTPEDLDALLAKREREQNEQEASRVGRLASAADPLAQDAGDAHTSTSPERGGSIDSGSGLTGDLGQRRILEKIQPSYPEFAKRNGLEGDVRLRVWVTAEGRVGRVEVVQQSGTPEMDRRAVEALKRWKFAPLPDGAAPVTQWGEIALRFRLD